MGRESARTILIVENSAVQARIISQHIETCTAFNTMTCSSLAELEDIVTSHGEDIFLAVMNLSIKDAPSGEAVDYALTHDIPCIVLTATFDEQVRGRFLEKNVLDYFRKGSVEDMDNMVDLIDRVHANRLIKVMVAEDNSTARTIMTKLLKKQNFNVIQAVNGVDALEKLDQNPDIQLVISDYEMPEMDGFTLISTIRKTYPKDKLAIIGVSAHSSGALTAKFLKNGANDFLTKPFEVEEFACRVNKNVSEIENIRTIKEAFQKDYLVGSVANRRFFIDEGRQMHAADGLNLAMLHLDKLGEINSSHSFETGDNALIRLAAFIEQHSADWRLVARSGARFLALSTQDAADFEADLVSIQAAFAATPLKTPKGSVPATCTVALKSGVLFFDSDLIETEQALYKTPGMTGRLVRV